MILEEIVQHRRAEVATARATVSEAALRASAIFNEPRRGFHAALKLPGRRVIAEVKKASPSRGVIRADFDPVAIATDYARNGAAAISVLTEERYFQGRGEYLTAIRAAVAAPLLRKDFVFDPYQIVEARALGADAVLLILAMLEDNAFGELLSAARELGLDALVEVHDEDELQRATRAGAPLIGVNNRNLKTFVTSLEVTERLAARVAPGTTLIAESGIDTVDDIVRLERCGVRAFLIGETLMRAPRPGDKLRALLQA
jgi:indole-3-glycerol phosphate synthase